MALYALENVDDAMDVTREFLTSIGRRTWLKLAVVVLFVGGAGGGFPSFSFPGDGGGPGTSPDDVTTFDPGPDFWLIVIGVVALVVALVLAFAVVGAIMEFVFVESLRTETVSVREYWSRHWRKGVRLFGFRLVVGGLAIGMFLLLGGAFVAPFLLGAVSVSFTLVLAVLLVLFPVVMLVAVLLGIFNSFTTMFVVPIMLLEDRGVIAGWRRLWPTLKAEWKQYLAYAVGAWVLSFAGGLFVMIVTAVIGMVLLVPFGVLAAIGFALMALAGPVGVAWFVLVGVLFGLAALLVVALAQVPVQTYLRYYALLVLGDVESEFDLIPEQRAAAREADDESDGESGDDTDEPDHDGPADA